MPGALREPRDDLILSDLAAGDLLGRRAEDSSGDFAEVTELWIVDRHGLLAEAAQRLFMLLGKPANPLGPLLVGAGESAHEL